MSHKDRLGDTEDIARPVAVSPTTEIDTKTLNDADLVELLNDTATIARAAYRLKKELEAELYQRYVTPQTGDVVEYTETPGGLTRKQITTIKQWAKKRHTTDDLIKFISELIQGETQCETGPTTGQPYGSIESSKNAG